MGGGPFGAALQFFLQCLGKELFQGHALIGGKGPGLSNSGIRKFYSRFHKISSVSEYKHDTRQNNVISTLLRIPISALETMSILMKKT